MPRPALAMSAVAVALLLGAIPARAQERLLVYGPGGPAPAMKDAGAAFAKAKGIAVEVTAGPTDGWIAKARADADVIFSGSEYMMTDFVKAMEGRIDEASIVSLYLRPSAILVRPGNPRGIRDLPDLARPGVKVIVVQGAGQTGLWEDMAGKQGDIQLVRSLRRNIVLHAANTAVAKQAWIDDRSVDAWIVYNIWQVANPTIADLVPVSPRYVVYRSAGAALTRKGAQRAEAREFVQYLQSKDGAGVFRRWGWMTDAAPASGM